MKSFALAIPGAGSPAASNWPIKSALSGALQRIIGVKDRPQAAAMIHISKEGSDIHHVECFDALLSCQAGHHPATIAFDNGQAIDIFLHDQSIVSGEIFAQDDLAYTVRVTEWTYFDNNILATMNGASTGKKLRKILELGTDICARYQSMIFDAKLVHVNRKGAIVGTALNLDLGEHVQISCQNHRPICGVVKWRFHNLAGLQFLRPMARDERALWLG